VIAAFLRTGDGSAQRRSEPVSVAGLLHEVAGRVEEAAKNTEQRRAEAYSKIKRDVLALLASPDTLGRLAKMSPSDAAFQVLSAAGVLISPEQLPPKKKQPLERLRHRWAQLLSERYCHETVPALLRCIADILTDGTVKNLGGVLVRRMPDILAGKLEDTINSSRRDKTLDQMINIALGSVGK
jgi:hypothetical protein